MLRIFMPVRIQRLRPGLNPQTCVPEASMLTIRPPKPSYEEPYINQQLIESTTEISSLEGTSPLETASTSAHRAPKYSDCWLRKRERENKVDVSDVNIYTFLGLFTFNAKITLNWQLTGGFCNKILTLGWGGVEGRFVGLVAALWWSG